MKVVKDQHQDELHVSKSLQNMKKVQDKELDVTTDNSNGSSALNASSREDSKQRIINLEKNYQELHLQKLLITTQLFLIILIKKQI